MLPNGWAVRNPSSPNTRAASAGLILSNSSRSRSARYGSLRSARRPSSHRGAFAPSVSRPPFEAGAGIDRPPDGQERSGRVVSAGKPRCRLISMWLAASATDRHRSAFPASAPVNPEARRRCACQLPEIVGEMAVAGEADGERDLGDRPVGAEQQLLGPADARSPSTIRRRSACRFSGTRHSSSNGSPSCMTTATCAAPIIVPGFECNVQRLTATPPWAIRWP